MADFSKQWLRLSKAKGHEKRWLRLSKLPFHPSGVCANPVTASNKKKSGVVFSLSTFVCEYIFVSIKFVVVDVCIRFLTSWFLNLYDMCSTALATWRYDGCLDVVCIIVDLFLVAVPMSLLLTTAFVTWMFWELCCAFWTFVL